MDKFEYVLFNTGYAGRLVDSKIKINKLQKLLKRNRGELILIQDEITGLSPFILEVDARKILEDLKERSLRVNGILIRTVSLLTIFRVQRQLVEFDYCADLTNILGAKILSDKYLIIEYGTESY